MIDIGVRIGQGRESTPYPEVTVIARSPQSYEKRRRELNKQLKRQQKLARRLERNTEKREDPDRPFGAPVTDEPVFDEHGNLTEPEGSADS